MQISDTMGLPEVSISQGKRYISIPLALFFIILLATLKISSLVISGFTLLLCIWALGGAKQAIQVLSLIVFIKFLNPALYKFSGEFGMLQWVAILLASLRLLLSASSKSFRAALPLLVFTSVALLLLIAQDIKQPLISIMKLLVFTYVVFSLLAGCGNLKRGHADELSTWLITLTATVVLVSLPTFVFPYIAYQRNGAGFQGILNHPQAFGPMMAPITSWLLAGVFFTAKSKLIKPIAIVILLLALMIATQARTSMVTVFLSLAATFLVIFFKKHDLGSIRIGRAIGLGLLAICVLVIVAASSKTFVDKLTGYVYKGDSKNIDQALSSRSGGVASQWQYFINHPFTGCGFGAYPSGEYPSGVVEVMGIPISAPTEKGFLPTAILEETGIFGGLAFLYALITLGKRVSKNGDIRWMAVFFACIFVNVGEMGIFSPGGFGLYYWLLIGLSIRIGSADFVIQAKPVSKLMEKPLEVKHPPVASLLLRGNL